MRLNLRLPALGALLLAGAALGVHLGQSAIEQINPIYFQGPAVHPRDRGAAVDPATRPERPRFAELYGWEEGAEAQTAECADCGGIERHGGGEIAFAVLDTGWSEAPRAAAYRAPAETEPAPAPEAKAEPRGFIVEWANSDRYASFAVEEKPQAVEFASAEGQ